MEKIDCLKKINVSPEALSAQCYKLAIICPWYLQGRFPIFPKAPSLLADWLSFCLNEIPELGMLNSVSQIC